LGSSAAFTVAQIEAKTEVLMLVRRPTSAQIEAKTEVFYVGQAINTGTKK